MKIWHGINDFDDFMLLSIAAVCLLYAAYALCIMITNGRNDDDQY